MKSDLLYTLQGRCCRFTFMRINSLRSAFCRMQYFSKYFFKLRVTGLLSIKLSGFVTWLGMFASFPSNEFYDRQRLRRGNVALGK